MSNSEPINIEKPRWDQSTYAGRARHFLTLTNPLNAFASNEKLERASQIVTKYRKGTSLKELNINEDQLWKSKYLYDSAYHPDTGEKMTLIGRMSAQVPMNMIITGCMLTFYQSTPAVIFWQWFNQSFNAVVNYTNRSGSTPIPMETLATSYVGATTGAVITALSLNKLAKRGPPLAGRLVPLAAVAAANCVNIPMMRYTELRDGLELQDDKGEKQGSSKKAARQAISSVAISRILMASPSMILAPVLMNILERRKTLVHATWAAGPIQMALCGVCLTFATPLCCALFAQRVPMPVDELEEDVREKVLAKNSNIKTVYYNKGL
ncbi:PREDICTED: sideroflexin-1 [Ceratosolen solmsi marchali]|uniref:Sidoreflexin n=1 Tax=Ceratosolen solmsi marchali TaxID=326594 RepID=A0AAJ6YVI0_9HYME|nr:PREDICTED: sideroflexin-1 [Ceratosolen solmsi marchali]XP_011505166.1 PREDICTED: sideroflexin-1 [Ceratosolen solmsi marchali]XP_011505168.1 PREDICTED: sideroflexin-1 [Ceratosolen solmsi marchali]